jgi:hypothetical protein
MVSHLATRLVDKYAHGCSSLLDPFCGSGAILTAASGMGLSVTGLDINPYAVLLSRVKLQGFKAIDAQVLCRKLISMAHSGGFALQIEWESKHFWFTQATVKKYEMLRRAAQQLKLNDTREGRAVLLAFALSIRRCSRADQRSPKPFISKLARQRRKGRHFDPYREVPVLLEKLSLWYGKPSHNRARVLTVNAVSGEKFFSGAEEFPLVITSPPYINAQDYFRNFKLELYLLQGLVSVPIPKLKTSFIGTERGDLSEFISPREIDQNRRLLPELAKLAVSQPRLAAVVNRYLHDMRLAFDGIKTCMEKRAVIVVTCGDNLVGGYCIPTWRLLNSFLEERGFEMFDTFGDKINRRNVPPKRMGHKGLIKSEVISVFRLID